MFGLVELDGGGDNFNFFFIFYLVWLLGCIPKIGFITFVEVP